MTRFGLQGDPVGLQVLAALFTDDPSVRQEEGGIYYLRARQIDDAVAVGEPGLEPARAVLETMNGAARLQWRGPNVPTLSGNSSQYPGGSARAQGQIRVKGGYEFDASAFTPAEAQHAVRVAEKSEVAHLMLAFLAAPRDGDVGCYDVYKVLEMLQDQVDHARPAKFFVDWMPRVMHRQISHSGSTYAVSGRDARHGPRSNDKTLVEPVTLEQAKNVLYPLVRRWFREESVPSEPGE